MRLCTEGHEYVLDFALMVQINVQVGTERPVQRRPMFVKDLGQIKGKYVHLNITQTCISSMQPFLKVVKIIIFR